MANISDANKVPTNRGVVRSGSKGDHKHVKRSELNTLVNKVNTIISDLNDLTDGSISTTSLALTGALTTSLTTDSTTKDTGSIITEGGIGVEKAIVTGTSITAGTTLTVNSTTDATTKDTGAIITEGGVGVEKAVFAGTSITATTQLIAVGDGLVGTPALAIGTTSHGLYEVSATQFGVSVAGASSTLFDSNGISTDRVTARVAKGTAGTNVTAVEYGDGRNFTTELTLSAVSYTIAGAANEAVGALVYTFPAGAHLHEVSYHSVAFTAAGGNAADTPDVGIGSVIGTGAVADLGGTATFEDYVTGSAAADCSGTALVVGPIGATAGIMTGISLNTASDVKAVHLNMAAAWTGADTITATGTIQLKWTIMS